MESKLLHAKFELNALNYPQQLALEYLHQSITYQALNEQANQLANFLIEKGILPGGIIAIHFTPGIQQIIAVLAVLKTGCAYLPIDVEHPTERIEYMIHNAGVAAILCDAGLAITNKSILTVFELNSLESSLQHSSTHSPEVAIKANDLAYIIYTSGSTGLPKGVMIEHGNAWNTLMQMGDIFPLTNTDKFSLNASLGFDPSVWMIFWPLMVGATVVLSSKEKDPVKICEDIIANQYRVFHAGPTLFRMLSSQAKFSECNSLRLIIGGGEAWKLADLEKMRKVLPQLELCNVYGPTEASIHVTFWLSNHCDMQSLTTVPIGKAIKHMQVFLLDEQLQEIAPGQVGDLYVAGAGIGRGYINNNELTAEKFIDANLTNQSVRLYSTGDLARILPDGNLVFMGRADDQIKLRGYRIEPTEIESQILKTGLANDVCVIGCLEEQTFSKLAAFIVAKETGNTTIDIIKKHLRDNLPEYMIPALFIIIDELPFTTNSKVDKKKLATLIQANIAENNAAPVSSTKDLLQLWRETLASNDFNEEDNFFDAGGDSLSALELVGKINELLGLELGVTSLFEYPTMSSFENYLQATVPNAKSAAVVVTLPRNTRNTTLSDNQLWLYRMAKGSTSINNIVLPFAINNTLDVVAFEKAVNLLMAEQPLLRSNIEFIDFNNHQLKINDQVKDFFRFQDITHVADKNQKQMLEDEYDALNTAAINLATDSLFKVFLLQCSSDQFYLYIYMHHLISDPATGQLIINKLLEFYDKVIANKAQNTGSDAVLFFDYVEYEKRAKQTAEYQLQLVAWQEKLQNNYLLKFSQPFTDDRSGASIEYTLPQDLVENIRAYIKAQSVTPFVFFLAIFKSCLYKTCRQPLFAVGINISKRNQSRWSTMLGPLSEQFLSIIDFAKIESFDDLLKATSDNIITIFKSPLTIENIYSSLAQTKDLFNVLFDYERVDAQLRHQTLNIKSLPVMSNPEIRRWLTLRVIDSGDSVAVKIRYRTKVFTTSEINNIFNLMVELLQQITEPEKRAIVNY